MFVLWDIVLEEVRIHVYDLQVLRKDIPTKIQYACNMSVDSHPDLEVVATAAPDPYAVCKGVYAFSVLIN